MDYGKYKYEIAKKEKASKSKASELKEVRMGRSMKIDPHDVEIRLQQATRFLLEGHKVQIVQNFKGREIAHRGRGEERMQEIISRLSEVGKVESPPRLNGRRLSMIFAPDRAKGELYKRKHGAIPAAVTLPDVPDDDDDDDE
jgi:translation initiation factor IF-3